MFREFFSRLFGKQREDLKDSERELLEILRRDIADRDAALAEAAEKRKKLEAEFEKAKEEAKIRKIAQRGQNRQVALIHLRMMERFLQQLENPGVSPARRAEIMAVVEARRSRVQGMGYEVATKLDLVQKKIGILENGG